ncbi:hypothetical protein LCGC14_2691600 [marine sediment metagenome]|uniref:Uncharacterized protein n=1 Tax=marine sediment metagenome TaxID=412755 RepID=A0A0F8ZIF6_9ZZZZ
MRLRGNLNGEYRQLFTVAYRMNGLENHIMETAPVGMGNRQGHLFEKFRHCWQFINIHRKGKK